MRKFTNAKMRKIVIEVIPQKKQKYNTLGDYWVDKKGVLQVRISKMENTKYEFTVLIHELVEWFLARQNKITEKQITKFDMEFEKTNKNDEEPGDQPKSPYYKEHQFASLIERILVDKLGIEWKG